MFSVHISFVTFWEARRFLGTGISNYSVWSRNCSWTPKVKRLDMNKSFSFAESVLAIAFNCPTEQLLPRSWVEPKAEGRLIRTRRNCQSATMVPRYNLSSLHITFHGLASVLSVIKVFFTFQPAARRQTQCTQVKYKILPSSFGCSWQSGVWTKSKIRLWSSQARTINMLQEFLLDT